MADAILLACTLDRIIDKCAGNDWQYIAEAVLHAHSRAGASATYLLRPRSFPLQHREDWPVVGRDTFLDNAEFDNFPGFSRARENEVDLTVRFVRRERGRLLRGGRNMPRAAKTIKHRAIGKCV